MHVSTSVQVTLESEEDGNNVFILLTAYDPISAHKSIFFLDNVHMCPIAYCLPNFQDSSQFLRLKQFVFPGRNLKTIAFLTKGVDHTLMNPEGLKLLISLMVRKK